MALAKEMAIKDGRKIVPDSHDKFEVSILPDSFQFMLQVSLDDSLFGQPFPKSVRFPKGAAENHKNKPRKLREDEY